MTTIRILGNPDAGIGDWAYGMVVQVEDRHAERLVRGGFAVKVNPPVVKKKKGEE